MSLKFFLQRFIAVLAVVLVSVAFASTASADARFVKSGPAAGALVDENIKAVTVVFSEQLNPSGSQLAVYDPNGTQIDQGDGHVESVAGNVLEVSLKPDLLLGTYNVRWTSASAVDGHIQSSSFHFTIAPIVQIEPEPLALVKGGPPNSLVRITFDQPLDQNGSYITVIGLPQIEVDLGDSKVDPNNPKILEVTLRKELPSGPYRVNWTAVTAGNEKTYSDSYLFTVTGVAASAAVLTQQLPPDSSPPSTATSPSLPPTGGWPISMPIAIGLSCLAGGAALRRAVRQR